MRNSQKSRQELRALYGPDYVNSYHQEERSRLARLLPLLDLGSESTVADFGCGNGLLLELIHDRIGAYHGVDFSEDPLVTAGLAPDRPDSGSGEPQSGR